MAKAKSMDLSAAVKTCFNKYADFNGRASRSEFWWFTLFVALVSFALSALNVGTPEGSVQLGSSLSGFWAIATLLPSFAVTVRRLRDAKHSWTNLFWLLLPIAGVIILVIYLAEPSKGK